MPSRATGRRAAAFVVALGLLVTGCAQSTADSAKDPAAQKIVGASPSQVKASRVAFTVTPDDAAALRPGEQITVRAARGTLTSVAMVADDGTPVPGVLAADATTWTTTGLLPLGSTLRYEAIGEDRDGRPATVSGERSTITPAKVLTTAISPLSGRTVGVGMPIVVRFNAPVANKAEIASHLVVQTSRAVEGAWRWLSDTEVHWRPRELWPAHTDVSLDVGLAGVDAGNGVWGATSRRVAFSIGASMTSVVDVKALTMTVTQDGKVIRTMPVTTGRDGFLTRNGTKVVLEKFTTKVMDSTTIGIAKGSKDYYRLDVPYAVRITWSGEFVHAAPWSVSHQGLVNVSHGCVGMSMADARWFFDRTNVGDVVRVVNSSRPLEPGNGYTDWNVPWSTWVAGGIS